MKKTTTLLLILFMGCSSPNKSATATIAAKNNSSVSGRVVFTEKAGKITATATISGVGAGPVAIHIHETGDCSSDDGKSAGGHWNPTGEDHGKWGSTAFHSGDIGNINIDHTGTGTLTLTDTHNRWSIGGPPETNILEKAIIIHLGNDDMRTQPTGAAGARIGCGVIKTQD